MKKILVWTSILISIIGAMDAIYLLVLKLSNNNAMCLGSGDCAAVNASRYSEVYGIPVSLFGILAYLAILGILALESRPRFFKENSNLLVFGLSLAGVLFSAYLTYLEFFVLHAICPFCIISAIAITIIFIISLIRLFH